MNGLKDCMAYEMEGDKPRGIPKKTWKVTELDLKCMNSGMSDTLHLVGLLVFNGTFIINRLYCAISICVGPRKTHCAINKPNKRKKYT